MHHGRAAVRLAEHLGDPGPELARGRNLAIVMNWSSSAASRKLIWRSASATGTGFGEQPQVSHRGRDAAGQLPRRVGAPVVKGGAVDGDRPHPGPAATRVASATTSSTAGAGRPLSGAVSGSAPRSIDSVARWSGSASATSASIASQAAG